jgi:hypothetical protein
LPGRQICLPKPPSSRRAAKSSSNISQKMNAIISALPRQWIYCCYNGEYLFYPFCESRSIGEMIAFTTEERRMTIPTTVVDLYAGNLRQSPDWVDVTNTYLDRLGYYAQIRQDAQNVPLERQVNIFGGLRRHFEKHVPWEKRRLDRVASVSGRSWVEIPARFHLQPARIQHNFLPMASQCNRSCRLISGRQIFAPQSGQPQCHLQFSMARIRAIKWHSQHLMDLGFMEPGQWF